MFDIEMGPFSPELRTHAQKVCSLYKKACRLIEAYYSQRNLVRYQQVQLREEFDKNSCISDGKDQRRLLWLGEHELFMKQHPMKSTKFTYSVGGVAHERVVTPPDWIVDYWHPLEKKMYPQYFACREKRKLEYIAKWKKGELY